ncbi:APC family permease [Spiroplasma endosymbiont of Monopis laevigella]|uniref:APC family permease n=2 Tax=Spiroplasma TaxID=2132 RepID=UPI0030CBD485
MKLKKKYSFWVILMMAISATVGSSVLISFGQVAFQSGFNPILMICAWILGGILILPEMLLLAETAISFPGNGSAYYWLKKANWMACSFWLGWILVLMVSATAVASATLALGNIIGTLAHITNQWLIKSFGILILFALAIVQIFIKNSSGKTQIIFTILKGLPITFVLFIAMIYGNTDSFNSEIVQKDLSKIFLATYVLLPATTMTLFAYSGIEAITYVTEEVENPRKNVLWALIIATGLIIFLYLILLIALLTINEPLLWLDENKGFSNVWYYAIINNPNIPRVLAYIFSGLAILLFVGSLNAFLLYQSRLIFKMSEEKDLFKFFQKTTKRTNMPWAAMLLLIFAALIYILWNQLYEVTNYFIIAISFLKLIVNSVIIFLRRKHPDYQKIFNNFWFYFFIIIGYLGAIIAIVGSFLAMYYYGTQNNNIWALWNSLILIAVMLAGYPVYYIKNYVVKIVNNFKNQKKDNQS